jgi:photosystem II stability/assembly factor-like uncharacterized protein
MRAWVGLAYTADGGANWIARRPPRESARYFVEPLEQTFFVDAQRGFLNGAHWVWDTDDSGATWKPRLPGGFRAVSFTGKTGWMAVEDEPFVQNYVTRDLGRTWTECGGWNMTNVAPAGAASFIDERNGWITIATFDQLRRPSLGGVARTEDGGCTWKILWRDHAYPGDNLMGIQFVDKEFGWLFALDGGLWRTTDGGHYWRPVILPPMMLESMYLVSRTRGWVLGGSPSGLALYETDDGGVHWNSVSSSDLRHGRGLAAEIPARWGEAFLSKVHAAN